ncbi:MAG: metal-dependent hydrolase [Desulfobacterales bacterium]|nr:metal-dependent hydrolase [Desulfobacterales bacterium]
MDSVTQIALGAAVGEAVLGRKVGRPALLWGAGCGLLPDLDVLIPLGDAVKDFTYHRSASHSLLVLALLTPLVVKGILKCHPKTTSHRMRWHVLVFLAFATHVLLDCLTVYGTQIFWPLPVPPVMWSTIFIVDPVYSVPLIGGVIAAFVLSRDKGWGHTVNTACLAISCIYLTWTVAAKVHVGHVVKQSLLQQGIQYNRFLTVPTPFNSFLWRVIVIDDLTYHEGVYSVFDTSRNLVFKSYSNDRHLLRGLDHHWPVKRLQWFTQGFYSVLDNADDIIIRDLRMGMEPTYVFQFRVGRIKGQDRVPAKSLRISPEIELDALGLIWRRIWNQDPP